MKKIIAFMICLVFMFSVLVQADWYVVSKDNKVLYSTEKNPDKNLTGIERREEKVIQSNLTLEAKDVEYVDGNIVEREKATAETELEQYKKEYWAEEAQIQLQMKKIAIEALKADGVEFKYNHIK